METPDTNSSQTLKRVFWYIESWNYPIELTIEEEAINDCYWNVRNRLRANSELSNNFKIKILDIQKSFPSISWITEDILKTAIWDFLDNWDKSEILKYIDYWVWVDKRTTQAVDWIISK
jgi:hypothetical protein